jgi:O-antigen/teichoic acid export membrane protein
MPIKKTFNNLKHTIKNKLDGQTKILFKNVKWVLIANIIMFVLSFARSIVLARGLGIEIFGVYTLITNFSVTVIEIFNLGWSAAIIKFGALFKAENRLDKLVALLKKGIRTTITAYTLALIVIAIILKFFYSTYFNYPGMSVYTMFYAISHTVYLVAAIICTSMLRLFFKFKINSIIAIGTNIAELLLISAAIYFYPDNLTVFFIAVIVAKLFDGIVCGLAAFWEVKTDLRQYINSGEKLLVNEKKTIWDFIVPNSIGMTLKTLINKGDIIMLGILGTPVMIAYYSIAKKLAFSILIVTDPMMSVIYPQLSKLIAEKKYNETIVMLKRITKLIFYPALILLGIIYLLREKIIVVVFGAEYAPAALPFLYLIVVVMLIAVFFWNLSLMQSLGVARHQLAVYVGAFITGAVALYLLIPLYGATGAAMGLLAAYIVITLGFISVSFTELKRLKTCSLKTV